MEQKYEAAFLFKRSFLGFFWGVMFLPLFAAYFWFRSASPETLEAYGIGIENPYVIGFIVAYGVVGVVYASITAHVKYVERVIRLMSEKDGEKMALKQSLLLSKKIFRETVGFGAYFFLKYYLLISIVYLVSIGVSLYVLIKSINSLNLSVAAVFIGGAIVIMFLGWAYIHFFLAAKTRFV